MQCDKKGIQGSGNHISKDIKAYTMSLGIVSRQPPLPSREVDLAVGDGVRHYREGCYHNALTLACHIDTPGMQVRSF